MSNVSELGFFLTLVVRRLSEIGSSFTAGPLSVSTLSRGTVIVYAVPSNMSSAHIMYVSSSSFRWHCAC